MRNCVASANMFSGLKKTQLSQGNVKRAHFGIFRFAEGQIETDGSQLVITHSEADGSIADACRSPPPFTKNVHNRAIRFTRRGRFAKARTIMMPDQFPVFQVVLRKRGRTSWRWHVSRAEGDIVMLGLETNRPAAKYRADSALFLLLLSAAHRSARLGRPEKRLNKLFDT